MESFADHKNKCNNKVMDVQAMNANPNCTQESMKLVSDSHRVGYSRKYWVIVSHEILGLTKIVYEIQVFVVAF